MNLKSTIESILFVADRPITIKDIKKQTGASEEEIKQALTMLMDEKKDTGIILLEQDGSYLFSTHPENSDVVHKFMNAELREKLSDASLETLAIIAYKQPVTRAEIESIRGVNSQYTLRILTIRGLIEKKASSTDARKTVYRTTHEFLQHLGLSHVNELPDFETLTAKVKPPEGFSDPNQQNNNDVKNV